MDQWRSGAVAQWRSGAVAQWRSGAVVRTWDYRLGKPEFEPCATVSNRPLYIAPVRSSVRMSTGLAIGSGGCLSTNSLRALIADK